MEKQLANTVIVVYAALNSIIALALFILALAVTFLTPFALTMAMHHNSFALPNGMTSLAMQQLATGAGIIVGIFIFMLAALFLSLARGLWKRHSWARVVQLAVSVPQLLTFPFGTLAGAFGIYAFAFDKEIREQFSARQAVTSEVQPAPMKKSQKRTRKLR